MDKIGDVINNILPDNQPPENIRQVVHPAKPLKKKWTMKLQALLNNGAIPLEPEHGLNDCYNCQGMGILMVYVVESGPYRQPPEGKSKWLELESGSGWYLGSLETDYCPVCSMNKKKAYLRDNSGLERNEYSISIADFICTDSVIQKLPAKQAIEKFLAMNKTMRGLLTFYGGYGVGKSMLMKALVNGAIAIEVSARYITLTGLLAELREQYGEARGAQSVEAAISAYKSIQVLCIDEIDRVNLTDWAMETIFRLMDARYQKADSVLTVMATNRVPDRLPAEFGYLVSRMRSGEIVEVPGPDMREVVREVYRG